MLLTIHLKMFWVNQSTRTRLYFAPPLLGHNSTLLLRPPCTPALASLLPLRLLFLPRSHHLHCSSAPLLKPTHLNHVDFGSQPSLPPLLEPLPNSNPPYSVSLCCCTLPESLLSTLYSPLFIISSSPLSILCYLLWTSIGLVSTLWSAIPYSLLFTLWSSTRLLLDSLLPPYRLRTSVLIIKLRYVSSTDALLCIALTVLSTLYSLLSTFWL